MAAVQRSHSETEYRDLLFEYQSLQRKFDSKVDALLNISDELLKCRSERDQYQNRSIDYADRCQALKAALLAQKRERNKKESAADEQQHHLTESLSRMQEENRSLQLELQKLRAEIEDSRGDNKLLRQQLARFKLGSGSTTISMSNDDLENVLVGGHPSTSSNIIEEFERLKIEHAQLERDLKTLLCEKEELVVERDAFKNKTERLNRELNYILNGDDRRVVADVDQVVAENRFLKEQLQHAREENGLRKAELSKYKSWLEKRKPILKNAFVLPAPDERSVAGLEKPISLNGDGLGPFVTPKQVRELLRESSGTVDHRALAAALNDTLNDRNLALSHQRKANKILGNRVTDLEARLHNLETSGSFSKSPNRSVQGPVADSPKTDRSTNTDTENPLTTSIDRLRFGVDLSALKLQYDELLLPKQPNHNRRSRSFQSLFTIISATDCHQFCDVDN